MKLIIKTVAVTVKVVLYPLAWILEWTLLFMAILFDKIDELSEDNNGTMFGNFKGPKFPK